MHIFFLVLIQLLYYSHSIQGVQYEVINLVPKTPGGIRIEKEVGIPNTKAMMKVINNFIWNKFQQYNTPDRVEPQTLKLFIVADLGPWAGVAQGDSINISASSMAIYEGNDFPKMFVSLLWHEMTHIFQWKGGNPTWAPPGLIEGVADYMTLISWYSRVGNKPGEGDKWDGGYWVTARFLEYCEGLQKGFVAQLNKSLRTTYSEDIFLKLLGKPVGQLWKNYKTKYGYKI